MVIVAVLVLIISYGFVIYFNLKDKEKHLEISRLDEDLIVEYEGYKDYLHGELSKYTRVDKKKGHHNSMIPN